MYFQSQMSLVQNAQNTICTNLTMPKVIMNMVQPHHTFRCVTLSGWKILSPYSTLKNSLWSIFSFSDLVRRNTIWLHSCKKHLLQKDCLKHRKKQVTNRGKNFKSKLLKTTSKTNYLKGIYRKESPIKKKAVNFSPQTNKHGSWSNQPEICSVLLGDHLQLTRISKWSRCLGES